MHIILNLFKNAKDNFEYAGHVLFSHKAAPCLTVLKKSTYANMRKGSI